MTVDHAPAQPPARPPITAADAAAIRATIDDYYLGWYDADGERMGRSLHSDLIKRGWLPDPAGGWELVPDTRDSMVQYAFAGEGRRGEDEGRGFVVEINDVYGDIASAVVHAVPYVDYLHLVRTADGWRILSALWCRS